MKYSMMSPASSFSCSDNKKEIKKRNARKMPEKGRYLLLWLKRSLTHRSIATESQPTDRIPIRDRSGNCPALISL
jgi:hypothetical protein